MVLLLASCRHRRLRFVAYSIGTAWQIDSLVAWISQDANISLLIRLRLTRPIPVRRLLPAPGLRRGYEDGPVGKFADR